MGSLLPVKDGATPGMEKKPLPETKPVKLVVSEQVPATLTVPLMGYAPLELAVVDWVRVAVMVRLGVGSGTFPAPGRIEMYRSRSR